MTTLRPIRLANASAIAAAVLWTVCAALVVLAPGPAMWVTGQMLHADLSAMDWSLTFGSYFVGLVGWIVLAWVVAAAIGGVYQILGTAPRAVPAVSSS